MIKIAVSSENELVCEHFGHCEYFNVFEVEDNKIKKVEKLQNPAHQPGFLPEYFSKLGINVIISGCMGGKASTMFAERNIEVVVGASGNVTDAVNKYLEGSLVSTGEVCERHEHRGECGGHHNE